MFVLAEVRPKPEHLEDARRAVVSIIEKTRQEKGCRRFEFYSDEQKQQFVLLEHWEDQAAFDFHHAQSYTRKVFEAYATWLAEPPVIRSLDRLEP